MRIQVPRSANGGLAGAVKQVAEHFSTIVRLELELARSELQRKLAALALGVGLVIGAAVVGLLTLGFAFATVAAALATFLSTWLALLITTAFLAALAGALALLGVRSLKQASPPVPEQALREASLTKAAIRH
jgi:hypothetical protein